MKFVPFDLHFMRYTLNLVYASCSIGRTTILLKFFDGFNDFPWLIYELYFPLQEEGTLMGSAFAVCFGYWFGVSGLMWFLSYVCNTHITILQLLSMIVSISCSMDVPFTIISRWKGMCGTVGCPINRSTCSHTATFLLPLGFCGSMVFAVCIYLQKWNNIIRKRLCFSFIQWCFRRQSDLVIIC